MVSTPHRGSLRIAPLAAADASPEVADVFAKTLSSATDEPLNIFATLAHQPRLLKRFNSLGGLFLAHGELPDRERELVILERVADARAGPADRLLPDGGRLPQHCRCAARK